MIFDILPRINASYEVPIRQASVLPRASFRQILTDFPLPLANTSPYRVHRGLSPPSVCALPGARIKKEGQYGPLYKIRFQYASFCQRSNLACFAK